MSSVQEHFPYVSLKVWKIKISPPFGNQIADVDHVKSVIWYDSLADLSVPMDVLPDEIYDIFNNDESDSTLMAILFDTSMSADETMDAIEEFEELQQNSVT